MMVTRIQFVSAAPIASPAVNSPNESSEGGRNNRWDAQNPEGFRNAECRSLRAIAPQCSGVFSCGASIVSIVHLCCIRFVCLLRYDTNNRDIQTTARSGFEAFFMRTPKKL